MRESGKRDRRRVLRPLLVFAALAALAVVLVPTGSAKAPSSGVKVYTACLSQGQSLSTSGCNPSSLPGGSTVGLTITITNSPTSTQTLGSVNLDGPVDASGNPLLPYVGTPRYVSGTGGFGTNTAAELQLRNLNLAAGSSVAVAFQVTTPCTGSNLAWTIAAKQSNNFSGTGNDFQQPAAITSGIASPGCYLGFVNQPADTQVGQTITDQVGSSGAPIEVGLFGSDGKPMQTCPVAATSCTATITDVPQSSTAGSFSGTTTQPLSPDSSGNLVASFGDLSIGGIATTSLPAQFTLHASSSFTAAAPAGQDTSNPFDIVLDTVDCTSGCSVNNLGLGGKGDSLLSFSTTSDYGFVILNPGTPAPTDGGCANWTSIGAAGFSETDQRTSSSGGMTVTYYVPMNKIKAAYGVNVGQQFIPMCVGAMPVVNGVVTPCYEAGGTVGQTTGGWLGDQLGPGSLFTGSQVPATCNSDGFYYGIIGSFQDPIDPSANPTVTSWSSGTINGTNYRAFVMSVPSDWDYKGGA